MIAPSLTKGMRAGGFSIRNIPARTKNAAATPKIMAGGAGQSKREGIFFSAPGAAGNGRTRNGNHGVRCRDGVFRQNERHHHVHKERAFTQNADNDQNRISQSDGSELRMVRDERRDISNDADEEEGGAAGNLKMAELFVQFPAEEPLDGGVLYVEETESEQPEEAQQGQLASRFKPHGHAA